jgi:hypothetical protein
MPPVPSVARQGSPPLPCTHSTGMHISIRIYRSHAACCTREREVRGCATLACVCSGAMKLIKVTMVAADHKKSSFYIGVAVLPLEPDEGFAKYLQSSAWMLADTGVLFETQQGTARSSLRERLLPSPDGGHTVEVNIPSLGTATLTAKNKFRKHRFAFKQGSLVKMELDRDAQTLRFCVDNKQWVTLTGVARHARPFLNFFTAGDGATLLQAESGPSIPNDLV